MSFENLAGDNPDNDQKIMAELKAAGIKNIYQGNDYVYDPDSTICKAIKSQSGEVKTCVYGTHHGWEFKRAWSYWICKGPGIDALTAERLWNRDKSIRVGGDCTSPNPRLFYKGLGCGFYHVDTLEGLKLLADTISLIVDKSANTEMFDLKLDNESLYIAWNDNLDKGVISNDRMNINHLVNNGEFTKKHKVLSMVSTTLLD